MRKKSIHSSDFWPAWLLVVLLSPALPLRVIDKPKEVVQHAAWLAYGIVLIASLVISALKSREKKSSPPNYAEILSLAFGLSLFGAAIATAVGFAGCVCQAFRKF
jgi:hypothetical protein